MSATLHITNLFSFTCPIFDANVQMRGCVLLRNKVYSGERLATRRGCQACVSSSKCPAAEIVRRFAFGAGDATDHCSSTEEKHGKLPGDVLERVAAVIVRDSDLVAYGVPQEERDLIEGSRARIEAQILTAPREHVSSRRVVSSQSDQSGTPRRSSQKAAQSVPVQKVAETTPINKAAATGDLAAALNTTK